MSNTKTFLTLSLLILLGSMGAAQAQIQRSRRSSYSQAQNASMHGRGVRTRHPVLCS